MPEAAPQIDPVPCREVEVKLGLLYGLPRSAPVRYQHNLEHRVAGGIDASKLQVGESTRLLRARCTSAQSPLIGCPLRKAGELIGPGARAFVQFVDVRGPAELAVLASAFLSRMHRRLAARTPRRRDTSVGAARPRRLTRHRSSIDENDRIGVHDAPNGHSIPEDKSENDADRNG
jgi:hypothetical protein